MTGSSDEGEDDPGMPEGVTTTWIDEWNNETYAPTGASNGPTTNVLEQQKYTTAAEVIAGAGFTAAPEQHVAQEVVAAVPEQDQQAGNATEELARGLTSTSTAAVATSAAVPVVPLAATTTAVDPCQEVDFVELSQDSYFVHTGMRGDVSDALFVAVAQMRPCGLTKDDRVGKYRQREEGFVGMCCKHCGGQPGTLWRSSSQILCQ
jgi:hypothetical protein